MRILARTRVIRILRKVGKVDTMIDRLLSGDCPEFVFEKWKPILSQGRQLACRSGLDAALLNTATACEPPDSKRKQKQRVREETPRDGGREEIPRMFKTDSSLAEYFGIVSKPRETLKGNPWPHCLPCLLYTSPSPRD